MLSRPTHEWTSITLITSRSQEVASVFRVNYNVLFFFTTNFITNERDNNNDTINFVAGGEVMNVWIYIETFFFPSVNVCGKSCSLGWGSSHANEGSSRPKKEICVYEITTSLPVVRAKRQRAPTTLKKR